VIDVGSGLSPRPRRRALPNARRWTYSLVPSLASLALVWSFPAAAAAQRAVFDNVTHRDTLENGMRVIVVENHAVPLATVDVVVKTGAMSQDTTDEGVPHLFEHMLFSGYRGAGDEEFSDDIGPLHAAYNGETQEELVSYYLTLPSQSVDRAIDILARLVREPHFETDDLNKERMVVLDEMKRDVSDPREHLNMEVSKLLWGAGWTQKNTLGSALPLFAATPQRLDQIFHTYYVPNNAALVVTGDVSTPKVLDWARARFGGWKRRANPYAAHPVPVVPPLTASRATVLTADVPDVTILVEWQGPSVATQRSDTYAADVLSQLVADEESEFQKRLVESGLFQAASLGYQTQSHVGPIEFVGTTTIDHLAAALTVLQTEVMMMGNDTYFDPDALSIAAKQRRVAQSFDLERGPGLAYEYADWWATSGLDYYMTYGDSLSARTPADVQRFATRYLVNRPFAIGALVRPQDSEKVSAMLQQYLQMTETTP
jgi:zinc protease